MSTTKRKSVRTVSLLLSVLLAITSFMPFGSNGGTVYAAPAQYGSPLTWVDYTEPRSGHNIHGFDIDNNGNIYLMKNALGLSIEKISSDGQSVTDITYNSAAVHGNRIAVDHVGNVYMAVNSHTNSSGPNDARVLKLAPGSITWENIAEGAGLEYVIDIAVDNAGNVYVTENDLSVSPSFEPSIRKLADGSSTWANITYGSTLISNPYEIAVDNEGNVFVSNYQPGRIVKLPTETNVWTDISPSSASVFFSMGMSIDYDNNLYVNNVLTSVVWKLAQGGDSNDWAAIELTNAPSLGNLLITDIAVDSSGYVYSAANLQVHPYDYNIRRLMATLTYNGNTSTGGTLPADIVGYGPGETATVLGNTGELTKGDLVFAGWNTNAAGTGDSYSAGDTISMTHSLTLYAQWAQGPSYTVSYQAGDGGTIDGSSSETVAEDGTPAAVPTATPDPGFTFLGWSRDGGNTLLTQEALESVIVTEDLTYTAYFQLIPTLSGIVLDSDSYTLRIGDTHQTVVTAVYSDESTLSPTEGVSFASSNPNVVIVDNEGLVTAQGSGQAVVTVEYEGRQAQANVTVRPASQSDHVSTPVDTGVDIFVDGVKQDRLATARIDTVDGRSVKTFVLDNGKILDKLKQEDFRLLAIQEPGDSPVVIGQLSASLFKSLEAHDAQIQIATPKATFTLPATQINIDSIIAQFGTGVELEDITVRIQISEASEEQSAKMQAAAQRNQYELIVHPVEFDIFVSYGSQTVSANSFNSYVARMIALPEDASTDQITTGVVLTADGELFHVPTVVIEQNGITYALINSLTNSVYSVIYNPKEMDDVKDHWARADVNDVSSRLIIQGATDKQFQPDSPTTRAEFAAIVTRGLGIQGTPYAGGFTDIGMNNGNAAAVQAAVDNKLVFGYGDGLFLPNQNISRLEAIVMLSRAAEIANVAASLTNDEVHRLLGAFTDGSTVPGWAQSRIAEAISLNLVNGRGDMLDLDATLTRAEAAALIRRFLRTASLID